MDSLTQIALGSAVGYAVLGNKVGRKAALWGAALGTLPDLDVLIPVGNAVAEFTYHRSFSHSLLVHLLISPALVWLILKIHKGNAQYRTGWFWLVFLCLSTHAILDSFTVYGTQLLWPLTEYPFALSNLFIIDPLITLPLLVGLLAALLLNARRPIAKANQIGLALSGVYLCWSLGSKVVIDNKVEQALAQRNIHASQFVSTPAPFTTLLWRIVVMSDEQYYEGYASVFDSSEEVSLTAFPTQNALLDPVKNDWAIQRLSWFTKGFYSVRLRGSDVVLSDLRMGVECGYAFNFNVARQTDNGTVPGTFERFSERPDLSALPLIWQRIWDSAITLSPVSATNKHCENIN